ncbi:Bifunctional protein putA [Pluralibacter gergoviae]|nr:Bifunctional protein putA [Pluralibacter gergoviae]
MAPVVNPAEPKDIVGYVRDATENEVEQALENAVNSAPIWFATPPQERAAILERAAMLMEDQMQQLMGILVREAGEKPSPTPSPRCGEAVDFLHYYAGQVRDDFDNENPPPARARWCASARGTSRWRSSPARLPPPLPPATACWRSPPSRRR